VDIKNEVVDRFVTLMYLKRQFSIAAQNKLWRTLRSGVKTCTLLPTKNTLTSYLNQFSKKNHASSTTSDCKEEEKREGEKIGQPELELGKHGAFVDGDI